MKIPFSRNNNCAHCGAVNLQYYGGTYGGYHYYFQCTACGEYTEYRSSVRNMRLMYVVIGLITVASAVIIIDVLEQSAKIGLLYSLLVLLVGCLLFRKYGWAAHQRIAIDSLPDDRCIIHIANKKLRLIVTGSFMSMLLIYAVIFFYNLLRQQ